MEIYLLEQNLNNIYDTYDSVVVIAENETEARKIHPFEYVTHVKDGKWMGTHSITGEEYEMSLSNWVRFDEIDKLKVTHIGKATENQEKGVLLASFNAG